MNAGRRCPLPVRKFSEWSACSRPLLFLSLPISSSHLRADTQNCTIEEMCVAPEVVVAVVFLVIVVDVDVAVVAVVLT